MASVIEENMCGVLEENISDVVSLHWILKSSDWTFDEIKEHLEQGFFYADELDERGRTPLLALVESANCSAIVIEILIQYGATVDRMDCYGRTPLLVALANKNCPLDVFKVLLYYGANTNHRCMMGISPLITALRHTREDAIIRLLLRKRANPIPRNYSDPSPLCVALCCDASKEVIKLLLDGGCPLNGCKDHSSVLHCATSFPNPGLKEDILEVLLEAGASVKYTDFQGHKLMCFALQKGANIDTIKVLLKAGVLLEKCNSHTTPLLCATSLYSDYFDMGSLRNLAAGGTQGIGGIPLKANVVKFLLDAESNKWIDEGLKPMLCALRYCDYETEAIKLLLDRGRRRRVSRRMHALCRRLVTKTFFTHNMKPNVIKLLIERGFLKVGKVDRFDNTLLHRALTIMKCPLETIKVLLQKDSSVYAENFRKWTPLEVAIRFRKNAAFLHLLLAAGSRIGVWARRKPHLLNIAFEVYDCQTVTDQQRILEKIECLKTLLKFAFLEDPDFDFGYLVSETSDQSEVLSGFAKSCLGEVQIMKSGVVGEGTLFDFITEKRRRAEFHELDYLLGFLLKNSFPIYKDLILAKIDKKLLIMKLQDLPVYTVKTCDSSPLLEQKSFLCYECSIEITQFISYSDILNFVLAFYYLHCNNDNGD